MITLSQRFISFAYTCIHVYFLQYAFGTRPLSWTYFQQFKMISISLSCSVRTGELNHKSQASQVSGQAIVFNLSKHHYLFSWHHELVLQISSVFQCYSLFIIYDLYHWQRIFVMESAVFWPFNLRVTCK